MQRLSQFAAALVCLFGSEMAFATDAPLKEFTYWVRVPHQDSMSCEDNALKLTARFNAATGFKVTQSQCRGKITASYDGQSYFLDSVLVTYSAVNPVKLYRASFGAFGFDPNPSTINGAFTTYSACLAELEQQGKKFEVETQLTQVSGFCEPNNIGGSYVLNIEGANRLPGAQAKRLFSLHSTFAGVLDKDTNQKYEQMIERLGGKVALRVPDYNFYYANQPISLWHTYFGFFSEASECNTQISTVKSLYVTEKSSDFMAVCLPRGEKWTLDGVAQGQPHYSNELRVTYYSFDECMQDRQRQIDASASDYDGPGHTIAVCSVDYRDRTHYIMSLF